MTEDKTIKYPKWMDEYFKSNDIVITVLPKEYRIIDSQSKPDKRIRTTLQFVNYFKKELEFWDYPNVNNNPFIYQYPNAIKECLNYIDEAKINPVNDDAVKLFKSRIITCIHTCTISSTTQLAKVFKQFADKSQNFFYGFKSAFIPSSSTGLSQYVEWQEGFYYGMQYKNAIKHIEEVVSKYGLSYKEALEKAEQELGDLLENSSNLFHDQEQKLLEVKQKTNSEIEEIKTNYQKFKETKEKQLDDLEKLYGEKLKLEKPADYWSKMSKKYRGSGFSWFITSFILASAIISLLTYFIVKIPSLFAETSYWMDILKNTAILSVITGVAIYILRITVKLSMSSFHLSRDAKEREQLSYFYLALMESKGITEQERILVISSLFSRADTGLLKGDSAPTMPQNISDIINKISK